MYYVLELGEEQALEVANEIELAGWPAPADSLRKQDGGVRYQPKHSDEALIRAYALGHAYGHHRVSPTAADWAAARSWHEA